MDLANSTRLRFEPLKRPFADNLVILAFFLVTGWISCSDHAHAGKQGDSDLKSTFMEQAPAAWNRYRSFAESLVGDVRITRGYKSAKETKNYDPGLLYFSQNGECALFRTHVESANGTTDEALVRNPAYFFSVSRKGEHPWVVSTVQTVDRPSPAFDERMNEGKVVLAALVCAEGKYLEDLVKQDRFKVVRAARIVENGRALVEIAFTNSHPLQEKGKPFCPIQKGTMILDPGRSWILRRGLFQCTFGNSTGEFKTERDVSDTGTVECPIPLHQSDTSDEWRSDGFGRLVFKSEIHFDLKSPTRLPSNDQFTLSAFGLPEPAFMPKTRYSLTFWVVTTCGLLALLLAAFFRRLRQRKVNQGP
jgi:hypothetical protein